jgi:hypothetical protein
MTGEKRPHAEAREDSGEETPLTPLTPCEADLFRYAKWNEAGRYSQSVLAIQISPGQRAATSWRSASEMPA